MKAKQRLVRQQLDSTLSEFQQAAQISIPRKGWVRAIRDALGMSGPQLAKRMGVSKQRIQRIEKDEISGSTTLKTMRLAAESLNCRFIYSIVPDESLDAIVRERARVVAQKRMKRASHTMLLEGQGLNEASQEEALKNLIEELINSPSTKLWDDSNDIRIP